jgi:hypothetical protein
MSGILNVAVPDVVGFLAMKLEAKLRLRPTEAKDSFDIYAGCRSPAEHAMLALSLGRTIDAGCSATALQDGMTNKAPRKSREASHRHKAPGAPLTGSRRTSGLPADFPPARTISTACALYSAVNDLRTLLLLLDIPVSYSPVGCVRVSTKPGQPHSQAEPPRSVAIEV